MNRMLSVYTPFSLDSSALRVVKDEIVTIKIKAKMNGTLEISVNCLVVKVRDL
jgi:hypothetical protein